MDAVRPGPDSTATLTVDGRYAGPPGSANGGYVAGRLAAHLRDAADVVRVTLRAPPPLGVALRVERSGTRAEAAVEDALVAAAEPGSLGHEPLDPVSFDVARAAMDRFGGLTTHPFPGCFVCGTDRPAPDGLGLRPGRLDDRPDCVATAWLPDASLATDGSASIDPVFVWAALDCPGGWSADLEGRPMVLGRITARVHAAPTVGEPCVVVGGLVGSEGRKTATVSTAYDGSGHVLGHAESVWIAVDPQRLAGRRET